MHPTLDRWLDAIKVALVTAAIAVAWLAAGSPRQAIVVAVAGGVAAWALSPQSPIGPHTPQSALDEVVEDGDVVVYWRPGCTVCLALMARLDASHRAAAVWVNVVRDADAAAVVRCHRDGDMVTPTAVTADGVRIEADAATIAEVLDRE